MNNYIANNNNFEKETIFVAITQCCGVISYSLFFTKIKCNIDSTNLKRINQKKLRNISSKAEIISASYPGKHDIICKNIKKGRKTTTRTKTKQKNMWRGDTPKNN